MISNETIKLIEIWRTKLFNEFTISEIMKILKKNTKTWVFNALKTLVKYKVLNSKRKGNLDIYTLNIDNPNAIQLLQYLETQENINFPQLDIISQIVKKIPIKNYSIIVFGSYASNKQTKTSDLDVCLLIENKDTEKKIKPYFNEIKLNTIIKIHEYYITFSEFIEMLLREEENLAKQIYINHKLFYNQDIYYQLIKEAYKHGFRP
jgi:predicted nucleotidyltransferase